jgi:hypothetical protein
LKKRERARAARAMAKVMRVAGDEEGEDGKAMKMVTRMAGEWTASEEQIWDLDTINYIE